MALEPDFRWIDDLVPANPIETDPVSQGDDHIGGIKAAVQGSVSGNGSEARLVVATVARWIVNTAAARMIALNDSPAVQLANAADTVLAELSAGGLDALLDHKVDDGQVTIRIQRTGSPVKKLEMGDAVTIRHLDNDAIVTQLDGVALQAAGTAGCVLTMIDDSGTLVTVTATTGEFKVNGQAAATSAAPTEDDHLTRRDYVDAQIAAAVAGLQTQINNLIDGTTKFTGAQEAPDFTAVP